MKIRPTAKLMTAAWAWEFMTVCAQRSCPVDCETAATTVLPGPAPSLGIEGK